MMEPPATLRGAKDAKRHETRQEDCSDHRGRLRLWRRHRASLRGRRRARGLRRHRLRCGHGRRCHADDGGRTGAGRALRCRRWRVGGRDDRGRSSASSAASTFSSTTPRSRKSPRASRRPPKPRSTGCSPSTSRASTTWRCMRCRCCASAEAASVINIASVAALRPRPGMTWYNATKAAVITLTQSMAAELAPDHIRVNCDRAGRRPYADVRRDVRRRRATRRRSGSPSRFRSAACARPRTSPTRRSISRRTKPRS